MFELIYIEREVLHHPQTRAICSRFPYLSPVICERYSEVFNRHHQNFRLQKKRPSLILARKFDHFVLPTPIGSELWTFFMDETEKNKKELK